MQEGTVKFVADAMLGNIARWLRILGYDVLYSRNYTDHQLLRIAASSGRTIITRDRGLYNRARRKGLRAILIEEDETYLQLAELSMHARIRLEADASRSRCPECNGELLRVRDKSRVSDRVPPEAYNYYEVFYVCRVCGRVYWEGGHWRNIRRILEDARRATRELKALRS